MRIQNAKPVALLLFAWLSCSLFSSSAAQAQRTEEITVPTLELQGELSAEKLLTMPGFPIYPSIALSPDDSQVAYIVKKTRIVPGGAKSGAIQGSGDTAEEKTELWLTRVDSGKTERIYYDNASLDFPSWSPDGKALAFYKIRASSAVAAEEVDALVVWNPETKAAHEYMEGQLTAAVTRTPPQWLAGHSSILIFTHPAGFRTSAEHLETPQTRGEVAAKPDPTVRVLTTSAFSRQNGLSKESVDPFQEFTAKFQSGLAIIDIPGGSIRTVSHNLNCIAPALSPDRKVLYYSTITSQERNSLFSLSDVHALNLATFEDRRLFVGAKTYAGAIHFSLSPNGQFLAFPDVVQADMERNQQLTDIVLLNPSGGDPVRLRPELSDHVANDGVERAVWSKDGKWVSFCRANNLETWNVETAKQVSHISIPNRYLWDIISTNNDQTSDASGPGYSLVVTVQDPDTLQEGFWNVSPASGKVVSLMEDAINVPKCGPINYQQLQNNGSHLLFLSQSASHPNELFEADARFSRIRQITHVAPAVDNLPLGHSSLVKWLDDDGIAQRGALMLPANYDKGRRYPMVVVTYPNANVLEAAIHRFDMAYGSINMQLLATRGYAVLLIGAEMSSETPMHDIFKIVLPGIQKAIDSGIADPERIGVTGGSDGGYATYALLVQSHIFKAAVAISGWANIISFESYESGRTVLRESRNIVATAWQNRDIAIENSPFFYLNRVQTPILIVHGSMDPIVPEPLNAEIFAALQDLGKEAVYVEYSGEGHVVATYNYAHTIDVTNRMIQWFDKFLRGQSEQ
jgi:dipeptidyl aminopeptidase/acylaminoacyl peptidase